MNILHRMSEVFETVRASDFESDAILGACARFQGERHRYLRQLARTGKLEARRPKAIR